MVKAVKSTAAAQLGRFGDVEATGEVERFVAFLEHIERLPQAAELRKRSYELLRADSGDAIADVGCGTGTAAAEMSDLGAEATGVDISERMVSLARRRFPEGDFRVAPAQGLPFEDDALDGYRAERLYQHLEDPAPALAEARRVLKPGGRLVLLDQDYDTWAVDSEDRAIIRTLLRAFSDSIANPWIGRRYRSLLLDSGFVDVTVEVKTGVFTDYAAVVPALRAAAEAGVAAGAVEREQADFWLAEQERRSEQGRLFVALPLFLASARRPRGGQASPPSLGQPGVEAGSVPLGPRTRT